MKRGFSLIELVVVMLLVAIIGGASSGSIMYVVQLFTYLPVQMQVRTTAHEVEDIIIEGDSIASAGCLFPLSQDPRLSKTMGMRHRAAIGLSEETDAVIIAVSEETGAISLAITGRLTRDLDKENLLKILEGSFGRDKHERRLLRFLRKKHGEI